MRCACFVFVIMVWLKSAYILSSGQSLLLKYSTPVLHGVVSLRRLIVTASMRSSAAANAVASVSQTFRPSTNLWKIMRVGCSINFVTIMDTPYTISSNPYSVKTSTEKTSMEKWSTEKTATVKTYTRKISPRKIGPSNFQWGGKNVHPT